MSSNEGPAAAVGDVNGDGLDDLFLGGSKGESAQLLLQTSTGWSTQVFNQDINAEDVSAELIDIDQDGDLDLLVASGGHEFSFQNLQLRDRIYLNDGRGHFTIHKGFNPPAEPSSFLRAFDFDNDGDLDLISGSRQIPFAYGLKADAHLFENKNNQFVEITNNAFRQLGLITDGAVADIDNDGDKDIVIAGHWMPITILENVEGVFKNTTEQFDLPKTAGLWQHINLADLDNDGRVDIIGGNHGLNTRLKASEQQPNACTSMILIKTEVLNKSLHNMKMTRLILSLCYQT